MNKLKEYNEEVVTMIDENTEVCILGFPDPFNPDVIDLQQRCLLKDSLHVMNKILEEKDFEKESYRYYDFSVLYIADERSYKYLPLTFNITGKDKFIFGYGIDKEISVQKEFKDILFFTDDLMVKVIKKET